MRQVKTIPPALKNLTSLVKLSLIDNLIEELPDEIGTGQTILVNYWSNTGQNAGRLLSQAGDAMAEKEFYIASFQYHNFTVYCIDTVKYVLTYGLIICPRSAGEMHWLEELSLIGNDIRQIPWSYGKMKSLAKLEITGRSGVNQV